MTESQVDRAWKLLQANGISAVPHQKVNGKWVLNCRQYRRGAFHSLKSVENYVSRLWVSGQQKR